MSYNPRYDKGDWKGDCDICGRTFKALSLRKRWDGFMVCQEDWETRHPQDFVRGIADTQVPVFTRPEPIDTFVTIPYTRTVQDQVNSFGGMPAAGLIYIDSTYFLSNYLYNGQDEPEFVFTLGKYLTNNTINIDTGIASIGAYIDPTYFATDYIRVVSITF